MIRISPVKVGVSGPGARVAIVTTHPIQYNAPFFRLLDKDERLEIKVFYTWPQVETSGVEDPEFKMNLRWDIDLLDGYNSEFVPNTSSRPRSDHFMGIKNPTLVHRVTAWNPDLIIVYGWAFHSHLKLMRTLHGKIPIAFRGDSTVLGTSLDLKGRLRRLYLKWVYTHIDYAYFVGHNNRSYYEFAGVPQNKLVFVPHAVDNERFARGESLREEFGIRESDVVFLYAGKFVERKNLSVLIQAFKRTNQAHAKLILAGAGELENQLREQAGDDKRIIFFPFFNQSEMPSLYKTADVFCLISKVETWGLAVNEAMAAGCAIMVSTSVGCAVDLVQYGINGEVYNNDDVDGMSEGMSSMINNRELLADYKSASKFIIRDWSLEQSATRLADHASSLVVSA